jgi:hypothetical protein
MYPKAIVKVLNLSRPGLEANNDLDIRIAVSDSQSMMLGLGRIRTAVEIVLTVPDPYDPNEPLCRHCRYVVAALDRSGSTLKQIPPDCRNRNRSRSETRSILNSCNPYTKTVTENIVLIEFVN